MSRKGPLNEIPTPGDGLPFETAEQFGEWWLSKRERLQLTAQKRVGGDVAEEILDAMLAEIIKDQLWVKYDPLHGASAETWCITRLGWRIADYFEKIEREKLQSITDLDDEDELSDRCRWADDMIDRIERRAKRKLLDKALAKLDPLEGEVIYLTYFSSDTLTEEEIAQKLGLKGRDRVAYLKKTALAQLKSNGDLDTVNPYGAEK